MSLARRLFRGGRSTPSIPEEKDLAESEKEHSIVDMSITDQLPGLANMQVSSLSCS